MIDNIKILQLRYFLLEACFYFSGDALDNFGN